jgi:signal transduction histidine kinase
MIHADGNHQPGWEAVRELETIGRVLGLARVRLLHECGDEVAAWALGDLAEPVARAQAPVVIDGRAWGTLIGEATGALPEGIQAHLAAYGAVLAAALSARAACRRVVLANDATLRRIERELHNGAQQRLVSLGLELRTAQMDAPPALSAQISETVDGLNGLLDALQELATRLHPAVLSDGGLRPALRALARSSRVAVELRAETDERFMDGIELAAYAVVAEALASAASAGTTITEVTVERRPAALRVATLSDGAATPRSRFAALTDRIEALGGTIQIIGAHGVGTSIEVELPPVPPSR